MRRFRPRRVRRARGGRREPDRHPSQGRRAVGPLQRLPPPGHALCTEETGRFADRIQCPYHGWTYGLDGRLLGAPHMDGVPGRREDGLTPVGLPTGRHLFVTLNPAPEPLDTQLNGLTERFAPWRMSELRRDCRVVHDVRANWKLVMLNYSECLPLIHPALQRNTDYLSGDNEPPTDTWFGGAMFREGVFTMNRDGRQRRPPCRA